MPTIIDHAQMLVLLRQEFAALDELASGLSESQWDLPTRLPGWTVRDNLSHIVGTESMLAGDAAPSALVDEHDHVKNAIGSANEAWVESMRALEGSEMLDRFRDVTSRRLAALAEMTQADFDAPSWTPAGPNETYGRFMRIRHFDCYLHEHDMRDALGVNDRDTPSHLTSALDEVATGLGFIVGKRAGLPQGSSARIELSGSLDRVFLVSVGERAALVDDLGGDPTVTLRMPAMLVLYLTGGRQDAAAHIDQDLRVEGDRQLALRLASNLAFTI
jgi:uncharacterized protein (TIGR03083 family)